MKRKISPFLSYTWSICTQSIKGDVKNQKMQQQKKCEATFLDTHSCPVAHVLMHCSIRDSKSQRQRHMFSNG